MVVVSVLSQTTIMVSLSRYLPPISYSTRLDNLIQLTLFFLTLHVLEFAGIEYATNRTEKLKLLAIQDSEGQQEAREMSRFEKLEFLIMQVLADKIEKHMRWCSPVVFTIAMALVLYT